MIDREPIPFRRKVVRPTIEQSLQKAIEDPNLNPECRMRLWLSRQPRSVNRPHLPESRRLLVVAPKVEIKYDMNDHI